MLPTATGIRTAKNAFSLVEVLIAIGVLGIGLGMVMLIFPAAIMENQSSVSSVIGPIMCQNALAHAKEKLRHDGSIGHSMKVVSNDWDEGDIGYPGSGSHRGMIVLARQLGEETSNNNDYLLVAIAYTAPSPAEVLELTPTPTLEKDEETQAYTVLSGADYGLTKGNSIIASNAFYTVVTKAESDRCHMKTPLYFENIETVDPEKPKQFFYLSVDGTPWWAMAVVSTRTALREP
jgi:prepilin-type N-terminal cleavage/methylation domain-containing protein